MRRSRRAVAAFASLQRIGDSILFHACAGDDCQSAPLSDTGPYLAIHLDTAAGEVWADSSISPEFTRDAVAQDPGLTGRCLTVEIVSLANPIGEDVPIVVEGVNQLD